MTIRKPWAAALLIAAMLGGAPQAARADQNLVVPVPGSPLTMTGLATYLNNAFASLGSNYSGVAPPAVFSGAAKTYQFWLDTSTSPRVLRINDGSIWVPVGSLDTTAHAFSVTISEVPTARSGTTDTVSDGDRGALIRYTSASPITVTLPAPTSSILLAGWYYNARAAGAGTVTFSSTRTIDGAAASSTILPPGRSVRIVSDGTNYFTDNTIGTPTTAILGGVFSKAAVSSNWLRSLGTDGNFTASQPAFSDVSGSVACSQMPALTGNVTTSAGACATTITTNVVADTMIRQSAGLSVIGRSASTTGNVADITGTANQFLGVNSGGTALAFETMSGDATLSSGAITIASHAVSSAKFRQSVARSVVGVTGNATADVADIQGTANQFLGVNSAGTALAFATMSGDATLATGVITIANSAVTYAKMQNTGALTLIGRSANSSGVLNEIAASAASDCVYRESGSVLGCGTIATAGIANNAVTLAKLATQATNTVLGNATAGSAVPTALTVGSCDTATKALQWTTNTGFACNSSITANAIAVGGITGLGTGVATWLATPSSANLAAALTDETGSGASVFGTAPTLSAPITTGLMDVQGAFKFSTQSAPAQITVDQNNYNPSSVVCASSATLLINSDAARNITGIAGGVAGCYLTLINNGSFTITLKDSSGSSTASNQFSMGGDFLLTSNSTANLRYDGTASRWRNSTGSGSGGGGGTVTQIICGGGLSGGTVTTSGTCATMNVTNLAVRGGGFDVWQLGTSLAVAASQTQYVNDGWYLITGANQASTIARITGIATGSLYGAKVQRNSGQTGTGTMRYSMPLDLDELAPMQGNYIALSFTVATGANWSPTSGTLNYTVYCGTGAVAKRGASGYTGETTPITSSTNLATSAAATRITVVSASTVGTTCTQAEIQFAWTPTGTASTNDWFEVDDLQLEIVSASTNAASPYVKSDLQWQIAKAQRFWEQSYPLGTAAGTVTTANVLITFCANVSCYFSYPFKQVKRVAASVTIYSNATGTSGKCSNGSTDFTCTASFADDGNFALNSQTNATANAQMSAHFVADSRI